MNARPATLADIPTIKSILTTSQLPPEGVEDSIEHFFITEDKGKLIGTGGFEDCGEGVGLLRSFTVLPDYQNRGIAKQLYEQVIEHARQTKITDLYLLTTTARDYFARYGFVKIPRTEAPEAIKKSGQFSGFCPASSTLMYLKQ